MKKFGLGAAALVVTLALGAAAWAALPKQSDPPDRLVVTVHLVATNPAPELAALAPAPVVTPAPEPEQVAEVVPEVAPTWELVEAVDVTTEDPAQSPPFVQLAVAEMAKPCGETVVVGLNWILPTECPEDALATLQKNGGETYNPTDFDEQPPIIMVGYQHDGPPNYDPPRHDPPKYDPPKWDPPKWDKPHDKPRDKPPHCYGKHCSPPPPPPPRCVGSECNTGSEPPPDGPNCDCTSELDDFEDWLKNPANMSHPDYAYFAAEHEKSKQNGSVGMCSLVGEWKNKVKNQLSENQENNCTVLRHPAPYTPVPDVILESQG